MFVFSQPFTILFVGFHTNANNYLPSIYTGIGIGSMLYFKVDGERVRMALDKRGRRWRVREVKSNKIPRVIWCFPNCLCIQSKKKKTNQLK